MAGRNGRMAGSGRVNPRMRQRATDAILRRMGSGDGVEDMKVAAGETRVKSTLEIWTDQQAHVITRLHRDDWIEEAVGQEIGLTRQRVNQIRRDAYGACKRAGAFVLCWKNI